MAEYPAQLTNCVETLPSVVDQAELNQRYLYVVQGLTQPLAEQLVEASRQPHVVEYCPKDAASRFANLENITEWQTKGRLALPLVKVAGGGALKLVGFGWTGPGTPGDDEPTIPGAETTIAMRLYDSVLGKGNALPYMRAILQANDAICGGQGVWLSAWADNVAGIKTYQRAGFQEVAEVSGARHGQQHNRVYMTLGNLTDQSV